MRGRFGNFINTMKIEISRVLAMIKKDDVALMLKTFKCSKEIHFMTLSDM